MPQHAAHPAVTVKTWFHAKTNTACHCLVDPQTRACAVIDSVLDFDFPSGRVTTSFAEEIVDYLAAENLRLEWILETHAHADHLSAAQFLKERCGGRIGIGEHIREVQGVFGKLFNDPSIPRDGRPFDVLFRDGETFKVGTVEVEVMHTPGHTPACVVYRAGDCAFVGDTLFMPDYGTARCDFPGGSAETLYHSVQRIFALPDDTVLYMCHDYMPGGREPRWTCTVAEQKSGNVQVHSGIAMAEFVDFRTRRDATLSLPGLIVPSLQVNVRAGALPPAESNGISYMKLPLNAL